MLHAPMSTTQPRRRTKPSNGPRFGVSSLLASCSRLRRIRQRRTIGALPWFLAGLALFCFFVAMEEISWAQRVFGHRPPEYFLAENYQQELNLHNIAGRDLRVWTFRGIVLGYGVVLPLLTLLPALRRWFDRIFVVPPPIQLLPSMLGVFWVHLDYPWKFTGEITECALGFGFLLAAMANAQRFAHPRVPATGTRARRFLFSSSRSDLRQQRGLKTGRAATRVTSRRRKPRFEH